MKIFEFLGEVKTAIVMNNWIEELPEEKIIERFSVQPGDLYRTIETAKWLLHAVRTDSSLVIPRASKWHTMGPQFLAT